MKATRMAARKPPVTELPNTKGIVQFFHCQLCIEEFQRGVRAGTVSGISMSDFQQLEVGFTREGLQVWCKRHDCNIMHVHFEGQTHPANMTRKGNAQGGIQ